MPPRTVPPRHLAWQPMINAAARRLGPLRRGVREVGLGLITLGVVILLFVAYQLFGTNVAESHSQAILQQSFHAAVRAHQAGSHSPTVGSAPGPSAPTGQAIDHLVIPKIGVDKFVVEGVAEADLQKGPGHYPQTVLPGQDGNAAIAGHRTTYGAPFFRLNELGVGDDIYLTDTAGRKFLYKVSEPPKAVLPTDLAVLDPTPYPQLTLTTCNPPFSATSRLVVVARLAGQAALPVTSNAALGAPAAIGALGGIQGGGNRTAWPPAVAYGAAALALWALTRLVINRTRRWGRLGAYVVGIAACLVPLWFCFENAARLLPQSI